MSKLVRIVEIMWLVIAAVSTFEIFARWNTARNESYLFMAFLALSIFMFYFRRRTRLNYEKRRNNDAEN